MRECVRPERAPSRCFDVLRRHLAPLSADRARARPLGDRVTPITGDGLLPECLRDRLGGGRDAPRTGPGTRLRRNLSARTMVSWFLQTGPASDGGRADGCGSLSGRDYR